MAFEPISISAEMSLNPDAMKQIEALVKQKLEEVGDCIYDAAYAACPVDTGRMRDSIRLDVDSQNAVISVNTDYAPITEYRTGWFSGAVESAKGSAKAVLKT